MECVDQRSKAIHRSQGKNAVHAAAQGVDAQEHGPELGDMLPLIGPERARKRLLGEAA